MKIQFYLNEEKTDILLSHRKNGESPHLTAKRLMETVLEADSSSPAPNPDELEYLQHQVERLEEVLAIRPDPAGPDRLDKLEERLESIESDLKSLALQFSDRLYAVIQAQEKLALDLKPAEESAPPPAASPTRLPRATKRQPKTEGETP